MRTILILAAFAAFGSAHADETLVSVFKLQLKKDVKVLGQTLLGQLAPETLEPFVASLDAVADTKSYKKCVSPWPKKLVKRMKACEAVETDVKSARDAQRDAKAAQFADAGKAVESLLMTADSQTNPARKALVEAAISMLTASANAKLAEVDKIEADAFYEAETACDGKSLRKTVRCELAGELDIYAETLPPEMQARADVLAQELVVVLTKIGAYKE